MEHFLKKKLQQDFTDCITVDKSIAVGHIRKEEGTLILFDMIDYVKSDIATMDKKSWEILNKAEEKLLEDNEKRKEKLSIKKPRDSAERRNLQIARLGEDYLTCKQILYFIQNLCYEKGWFQ